MFVLDNDDDERPTRRRGGVWGGEAPPANTGGLGDGSPPVKKAGWLYTNLTTPNLPTQY